MVDGAASREGSTRAPQLFGDYFCDLRGYGPGDPLHTAVVASGSVACVYCPSWAGNGAWGRS